MDSFIVMILCIGQQAILKIIPLICEDAFMRERLGAELAERIVVLMPAELIQRVDDVWHDDRLANRSAAIRRLIEEALNHRERKKAVK